MMDMPTLGVHYHPYHSPAPGATGNTSGGPSVGTMPPQRHLYGDKTNGDFNGVPTADLSLGHHPNCTIASSQQQQRKGSGSFERDDLPKDTESIDTLYLTPEAYRATEAIEFIAEHLRSEDEYIQVRDNFNCISCYQAVSKLLWSDVFACAFRSAKIGSMLRW